MFLWLEALLFPPSAPRSALRMFCLLALLGTLGCTDDDSGGGTLHGFDNHSRTVQVWKGMAIAD